MKHENAILVLCAFRGRRRDRYRPLGIDLIDSDTDSDPEVYGFFGAILEADVG